MNQELNTPAVELLPGKNRFEVASRLWNQLHRSRLVLGKYWWILPLVWIVILAPVYFFTAYAPPEYESKARMWLAGKMNLAEGRIYTEDLVNFLGTQAELLRSRAIQERVLAKIQSSTGSAAPPSAEASGSKSPDFLQTLHDELFQSLQKLQPSRTNSESPYKLKVTESSKSSILELRALGPEPQSTRAFLDGVMNEYLNFKREVRSKTSDQASGSLSQQLAQLTEELKVQQEKLHNFRMSNNVVFLQEQGNSAGNYLAALTRQLAVLRTQVQLLQTFQPEHWMASDKSPRELGGKENIPGDASADNFLLSLAGPQSEVYKASQQAQLLKAKRNDLGKFLRPSHPKMIKLDEDIQTQEHLARIARQESLDRIANRRQSVELEIKNLEVASREWDVKAIDASRKIAEYDRIRQDLQRLQAAYDRLLGVMQTLDLSKVVDQENMGIMEGASKALPSSHLLRNLLLGAVIGLLIGGGLVYFTGRFDDRFTSFSELGAQLGEVVIGQIPQVSLKSPNGELRVHALERHRFEFLESFRNIRSYLLFTGNGDARSKVILINSAIPEEGKSTVALYLAAVMAMGGARVLLVDADMRRATLHKYLDSAGKPGLAEILAGEIRPESGPMETSLANLALLPAGEARHNPGELLLSPVWKEMIRTFSSQFDYVFIDSPPLLATDDAATLAPKVDGVLFVVRGAFTRAKVAREALDLLRQRRARLLGVILNCAVSTAYEQHPYRQYKSRYRWDPRREERSAPLVQAKARQLALDIEQHHPANPAGR